MDNEDTQLRRSSIHDVASHAGVSAATVSKVLQGVATVRPENVQRVRDAIAALDYRVDPFASDMRRSHRRMIGVIVPELESEFFGSMVMILERLAEARGYALVVTTSRESEDREAYLIERMNDWRVAGVVLAPVRNEKGSGAARLKRYGLNAVLIDRVGADEDFDTISADGRHASGEVARLLSENGHRHVAIVGLSDASITVQTRIEGFCKTARALDPDMQIDIVLGEGELETLRTALKDYLDENRPTAIFSLFLKGTLAALSELRRRGLQCPDDLSLVGFDDAEWMQATYPSITAVIQPVEDMSREAMNLLFERIEGCEDTVRAHLSPCRVVMRESVATIPSAGSREETAGVFAPVSL